MEKILNDLDVRQTTKDKYQQLRRQFFKKIIPYQGDDPKFLLDTGFVKIASALGDFYKDKDSSSIRKHLDWINNICKAMGYTEMSNDITEQVILLNSEYVPSSQKEKSVKWEDVMKVYNERKEKDMDWFIASFFVHQPPRRTTDYAGLQVVKSVRKANDVETNYLVKNKKNYRFVFNYYKNSDKRGRLVLNVSQELHDIIEKNETHLDKLSTLTDIDISKILNRFFGFGVRELRKSYISEFHKIRRSRNEIVKLSEMMSHEIESQIGIYRDD
jgi:hypothetical protein